MRSHFRLKVRLLMTAVAKWFYLAEATSAKRDGSSPCKIVFTTVLIIDFKITLHTKGSVVLYNYFGCHLGLLSHFMNTIFLTVVLPSDTSR